MIRVTQRTVNSLSSLGCVQILSVRRREKLDWKIGCVTTTTIKKKRHPVYRLSLVRSRHVNVLFFRPWKNNCGVYYDSRSPQYLRRIKRLFFSVCSHSIIRGNRDVTTYIVIIFTARHVPFNNVLFTVHNTPAYEGARAVIDSHKL